MSLLAAGAWTIAVTLLTRAAVHLTELARPGAQDDLVNVTVCHALGFFVVVFAIVRIYAPETRLRASLGLRTVSPVHVVLSVIAGAGLYPGSTLLVDLVTRKLPASEAVTERVEQLERATSVPGRVGVAIAFVLVLPLLRELFFRGVLFGGVKVGRSAAVAVVTTSLCFALPHDVRVIAPALALALVTGTLRAQSGSVISPVLAHVAYFGFAAAAELLGKAPASGVYTWRLAVAGVAASLTALLLAGLLASRDERAARFRAEDA